MKNESLCSVALGTWEPLAEAGSCYMMQILQKSQVQGRLLPFTSDKLLIVAFSQAMLPNLT